MPTMTENFEDIYKRQSKYYKPLLHNRHIVVLGCGSLGGNIAVALSKLGLTQFDLYDFDKVERHNIPNQPFNVQQLGYPKTTAVKDMILSQFLDQSLCNVTEKGKFDAASEIPSGSVLINGPDSILVREEAAHAAPTETFIIDVRSGPESYNVYFCDKRNPHEWDFYRNTFFKPSEAVGGGCGAQSTVFGNLDITALAVNGFVRYANRHAYPAQINGDLLTLDREQIYLE